jgi:hypothetical protein
MRLMSLYEEGKIGGQHNVLEVAGGNAPATFQVPTSYPPVMSVRSRVVWLLQ